MKTILLFLISFISITVSAQTLRVTTGNPISAKDLVRMTGNMMVASATMSPNFFFDLSLKRAYANFGIGRGKFLGYNNFVTPVDIKKLSAEFIDDQREVYISILRLINMKDKLFAFYITLDKAKDEISVYVNQVSNDLVLMGSPVLVKRYKTLSDGSYIDFRPSPNNKYFLLTRTLDGKPKEPMQFDITLIDEGFGQVVTQSINTDYSDRAAYVSLAKVDDNGNFYVVESASDRSGDSKLRPQLHLYNASQKKMSKVGLGLPNGSTYGVNAMLGKNNELVIAGLSKAGRAVRCFKQTLDPATGTITQDASSLMPDHYYEDYAMRSFSAGDWRIADIASLDNGTTVATLEAQITLVNQEGVEVSTAGHYTYVLLFKPEGKVNFNTIYKKQSSMKSNCGSALIVSQNKFFIIYNDNSKNLKLKPEDEKVDVYRQRNSMIVVQEFDENGKITKYPLVIGDKLKTYNADIGQFTRLDEGQFFLSAFSRKNLATVNNVAILVEVN